MGRSVAVVCPKGGVGKTTVAVNLGSALTDKGFRCLLIGVDPQCGLISSLGKNRFDIDYGLLDFYDPEGSPEKVIQASGIANLDFITSNIWSREEEKELLDRVAAEPGRLAEAIVPYRELYDFILLDCPPSLGALTYAAMAAADSLLIPLQAEELAYQALPRLFDSLDELAHDGNKVPELMGILLNQVDTRTRLASSVIARVQEEYGEQVFRTMIPRTVRLAEVAQRGRPVNRFNRSGAASRAFEALADEILQALTATAVPKPSGTGKEAALAAREPEPAEQLVAGRIEAWKPAATLGSPCETPGQGGDVVELLDNDRILSLDEIAESEQDECSCSRPSLDDYDGNEEESRIH